MKQKLITFCVQVASMNENSIMTHSCVDSYLKEGWSIVSVSTAIWQHDLLYITVLFKKS